MTLEYLKEYRTHFHIGQSYGISESSAYKAVKWVKNTLIKHLDFALLGRKTWVRSKIDYETTLIDATETPIEHPKKVKTTFTRVKRRDIL